ncbi:type 2 phosphatidylinositol 4,5-bisphosphate 4-phosphatase isoform X2 [Syngnathoides biaculeatus]|uniref:type 2 phosphatidylinositol 4,5-bisphosphate 4-phosphatase isoform X2 n=1 Tax=Syngnathoides biaculeatus TaxID=300417 RepID=UPI002ADDCD18|nr:type 2 phosphatidylinositol 4,5-bisphosphate 4-phosphatase isoform X2 [Syngnathoides biaculeatus]
MLLHTSQGADRQSKITAKKYITSYFLEFSSTHKMPAGDSVALRITSFSLQLVIVRVAGSAGAYPSCQQAGGEGHEDLLHGVQGLGHAAVVREDSLHLVPGLPLVGEPPSPTPQEEVTASRAARFCSTRRRERASSSGPAAFSSQMADMADGNQKCCVQFAEPAGLPAAAAAVVVDSGGLSARKWYTGGRPDPHSSSLGPSCSPETSSGSEQAQKPSRSQ